jgi:hypothetical protein
VSEGRRPEIVLVDRDAAPASGLTPRLFEAGFDVYRTPEAVAARELIGGRSSILMAVVRLDPSGADAARTIRELARARPGLWIGMLGAPGSDAADRGYRAGADDLLPAGGDPAATAFRLARSVPWALRKRKRVARRRRSRAPASAGVLATAALALATGLVLAAVTKGWLEAIERWDLRLDRVEKLLEGMTFQWRAAPRGPEFRTAAETLDLERRRLEEDITYRRRQLDESRLDNLFRNIAPHYPGP